MHAQRSTCDNSRSACEQLTYTEHLERLMDVRVCSQLQIFSDAKHSD